MFHVGFTVHVRTYLSSVMSSCSLYRSGASTTGTLSRGKSVLIKITNTQCACLCVYVRTYVYVNVHVYVIVYVTQKLKVCMH